MSNLLENICYDLPDEYKARLEEEDCHYSDGDCPSLEVVSDYIEELEKFRTDVIPFLKRLKEHRHDKKESVTLEALETKIYILTVEIDKLQEKYRVQTGKRFFV